jgi:hypothetical protein
VQKKSLDQEEAVLQQYSEQGQIKMRNESPLASPAPALGIGEYRGAVHPSILSCTKNIVILLQ